MATGPNQHFIPQALLRRFRIEGDGRVHVYASDRVDPKPTKKVASGKHFYSKGNEGDGEPLDSIITRHENGPFNIDFQKLIALPPGPVDAALAARIVAHLAGRGDHLRGTFRSGATAMADMVSAMFGDADAVAQLVGIDGPLPGPRFRKMFEEVIAGNEILAQLNLPMPVLMALSYMILRENREGLGEASAAALSLADTLRSSARTVARDAQVKALTTSLTPEARILHLSAFEWRVIDMPGPGAILPDFVILARDRAGISGTLFAFDQSELGELLLPLSSDRMLVGQAVQRDPALDRFNDESAPFCRDFFVSAYASPDLAALAKNIGAQADTPVREGLAEAASQFRVTVKGETTDVPADAGPWRAHAAPSFELESDTYTQEDAHRLGQILAQLVTLARARFDTDSLFSFVVCADYAGAVAAVDRGELDDGTVLEPSSDGVSFAYNVSVERGGKLGIVTVLDSDIATALLSDDDLPFAGGAATVLAQLARIGADQLLGAVFAADFDEGEAHDLYLMHTAIWCWKTWLVAGYQSMFSDEVADFYRAETLERLGGLASRLTDARRVYRVGADIDALLETAVAITGSVLSAATCAAAAGGEEAAVQAFRDELAALGWGNWFALLEHDLAAIWREGTAYPPPASFLVLARHIQRLLVAGAIFLWSTPEKQLMVEVPYWSDLDWIAERSREAEVNEDAVETP